jgi:hypothetical protein
MALILEMVAISKDMPFQIFIWEKLRVLIFALVAHLQIGKKRFHNFRFDRLKLKSFIFAIWANFTVRIKAWQDLLLCNFNYVFWLAVLANLVLAVDAQNFVAI